MNCVNIRMYGATIKIIYSLFTSGTKAKLVECWRKHDDGRYSLHHINDYTLQKLINKLPYPYI